MWRLLLILLLLAVPADAQRVLRVGPGGNLAWPSPAAAMARAGDRVVIGPGTYTDCAIWRAPRLTIEAEGEVEISGPVCGGKALFVVAAPDVTVIGVTFRGAAAPDENGAGIRAEGGSLTVRRARFFENQNGILTMAHMPGATLRVEDSTFIANGFRGADCAHALYAGELDLVSIHRSHFEATRACHHVKSRAARTDIIETLIADGVSGGASYLIDLPNGGALLLRDSVLRKGPRSGNGRAAVVIGAEGLRHPPAPLVVERTRFANLMPRPTTFLRNLSPTPALLRDVRFEGLVIALEGPGELR
jgi:hypothetical protein